MSQIRQDQIGTPSYISDLLATCPICKKKHKEDDKIVLAISSDWEGERYPHEQCVRDFWQDGDIIKEEFTYIEIVSIIVFILVIVIIGLRFF